MNVTLHQMQVFLTVAEHKSITKAADALHLTQPAVSIQLKNLQEQLQSPLVEIIGRQLYLTKFGEEMKTAAKRLMREMEAIEALVNANQGELSGPLSIAVVSTGKYVMPYFLTGFTHAHPGVELTIDVTNRANVIAALEQNEPDFALVSVLPDNLALERIPLMPNELFLVATSDWQPERAQVAPEIMETEPLIFREPGSATRRAMEGYLRQHGLQASRKMALTSNEAVKQALIAGLGLSVMPLIGIRQELDRGTLRILDCPGFPIRTTWNLIWLRGKQLSSVAAAFLNYLQQEKKAIIERHFPGYPPVE